MSERERKDDDVPSSNVFGSGCSNMGFERRDLDELDMAICDSRLDESFDDEDDDFNDDRHGQQRLRMRFILDIFFEIFDDECHRIFRSS